MTPKKRSDQIEPNPFVVSNDSHGLPEDYTRGWLPKEPDELSSGYSWDNIGKVYTDIEWFWENYIANGFVTMFAGYSGVGKSFLLLRLCGCITNGWEFPDGSHYKKESGSVLWAEGETAQRLNYVRGKKMGLNMSKFLYPFDQPFIDYDMENQHHNQRLLDFLSHREVKLLVIDSLSGVHNGDENSSDMNRNIKFLATTAQETQKPILITHHLKKKTMNDAKVITLQQVRGSSAIVQNTRLVIGIDIPGSDQHYKRVQVLKSNLSEIPDPFAFRIKNGNVEFVPYTKTPESKSQRDQAIEFLRTLLAEGPRKVTELSEEAKNQGITKRTLDYAKKELRIESNRIGGSDGYFTWELPETKNKGIDDS